MQESGTYRHLTNEEIKLLEQRDCRCENWDLIEVAPGFSPNNIRNVNFSGHIRLGVFQKEFTLFGGVKRPSGIANATIHNCVIGNNVYIGQVRNYIANYVIEDDALIDNVDIMAVDGCSRFGNGVKVAVLSETGGREVPIFDRLSAQMAYIMTLYRHRVDVIKRLLSMVETYAESISSTMGRVGKSAQVTGCRSIKNVCIGNHARVQGVYRLCNGTINSCSETPTEVGSGVVAEDFIISSGSRVDDGTVLHHCFVGQGCELAKQYSAENSLFFANCAGYHGEACSIFAGPFTVTHHKSTLLIAGMVSFMNAGSGSNQSNHMYKLGPIHQGIMERGAKTSSDSYILWPAKVGAFTTVMGRHYKHSDTSCLPFSYLIEQNDQSVLVPGVSLRSVGTIRDAQKFPKRDKRSKNNRLDFVNYNLLSPYTIDKMMCGIDILHTLQTIAGKTSETYSYNNTIIRKSSLEKGVELYKIAITKFLGNSLISRLENNRYANADEVLKRLIPDTPVGLGRWIDVGGMIAPQSEIEKLLDDIENGTIADTQQLHEHFEHIHESYYTYEWTWAFDKLPFLSGKLNEQLTIANLADMVKQWKDAVVDLDWRLYSDAQKEFSLDYQTSFGTDGCDDDRKIDFAQVRGELENNPFVVELHNHIERKSKLAESMLTLLQPFA